MHKILLSIIFILFISLPPTFAHDQEILDKLTAIESLLQNFTDSTTVQTSSLTALNDNIESLIPTITELNNNTSVVVSSLSSIEGDIDTIQNTTVVIELPTNLGSESMASQDPIGFLDAFVNFIVEWIATA